MSLGHRLGRIERALPPTRDEGSVVATLQSVGRGPLRLTRRGLREWARHNRELTGPATDHRAEARRLIARAYHEAAARIGGKPGAGSSDPRACAVAEQAARALDHVIRTKGLWAARLWSEI